MNPPRWNDEEAVDKLVGQIVDDGYDMAEFEFANLRWDTVPAIRVTVTAASRERAAMEHAERGNFTPLADILERGDHLGPEARAMMASKLREEFKARKGPRKQTLEQRELKPAYWAAKEVEPITTILKQQYPNETGHRDRAISIAAKRAGISRQELVTELGSRHNKRPRKRPRKKPTT